MTLDPDPLTVYPDTDDEPWEWLRWDRSDCPQCGDWRDAPNADCAACGYAPKPDARRWWALAIAAVVLFAVAVAWWR